MKGKKKLLVIVPILIVVLFAGMLMFGDKEKGTNEDSWAIYVYMCGSDLESGNGAATEDQQEMIDATAMNEHTKIVVETGVS